MDRPRPKYLDRLVENYGFAKITASPALEKAETISSDVLYSRTT